MSLEEELVASSFVLADQREHIKDLEELLRDLDTFMWSDFPKTWRENPKCILFRERMKELGVIDRKDIVK